MKKIYRFRSLLNKTDFYRLKQIIETGYFWCSNFWELNDPMEGVFSTNNSNIIKDIFFIKEDYKICSFSGKDGFKNPAMWGYYAGGFKGVAIEIETDIIDDNGFCSEHGGVKKIKPDNDLPNESNIEDILLNKDENWGHEDEFRFLIKSDNNFHKIGRITKIYFGNPYGNIENKDQVKEKSKSFAEYEKFKKEIKDIATNKKIKYKDVKVEKGEVL